MSSFRSPIKSYFTLLAVVAARTSLRGQGVIPDIKPERLDSRIGEVLRTVGETVPYLHGLHLPPVGLQEVDKAI